MELIIYFIAGFVIFMSGFGMGFHIAQKNK